MITIDPQTTEAALAALREAGAILVSSSSELTN